MGCNGQLCMYVCFEDRIISHRADVVWPPQSRDIIFKLDFNTKKSNGSAKYPFFLENALKKTTEYFLKFLFFIWKYNSSF